MRSIPKTIALLINTAILPFVYPAAAGRPLTIDDAEPVPPRHIEFEAGSRYSRNSQVDHFDLAFGLVYGVASRLEAGLGFGGQFEEREDILGRKDSTSGLGDLTLATKVKVLTADQAWADHSFALSLKAPTASRDRGLGTGEFDSDLMWIGSRAVTEKWNAHANVGYTWVGDVEGEDLHDILHYGVATDYRLRPDLQLVAEAFAASFLASDHHTSVFLNGGLRWSPWQELILDMAIGAGVRGPAPDFMATVGLTWVIPP